MRLIDADVLIEKLHEWDMQDLYLPCHFDAMIEEQPTAYDVEEVMAALESEAKRWKESGEECNGKHDIAVSEGFKLALEIVKRGEVK